MERALGERVKGANALHLVAEELDPDRRGKSRGEDVEDSAAYGKGPLILHQRDVLVTEADQPRQEPLPLHLLADHQVVGVVPQELPGQNLLGRTRQGGDHPTAASVEEPEEGIQPPAGDLGHRRRLFKGGGVPGGEEEDLPPVTGVEEEFAVKVLGAVAVRGDDEEPALDQGEEPCQKPGGRRPFEAGNGAASPFGEQGCGNASELFRGGEGGGGHAPAAPLLEVRVTRTISGGMPKRSGRMLSPRPPFTIRVVFPSRNAP